MCFSKHNENKKICLYYTFLGLSKEFSLSIIQEHLGMKYTKQLKDNLNKRETRIKIYIPIVEIFSVVIIVKDITTKEGNKKIS